jgi:hypothetical protein
MKSSLLTGHDLQDKLVEEEAVELSCDILSGGKSESRILSPIELATSNFKLA